MNTFPEAFTWLMAENCLQQAQIAATEDGFHLANKSLSDILAEKEIFDFPDSNDRLCLCRSFFDDWFLYAVPNGAQHTYSLLKQREQEYDANEGAGADGDIPGVTISFIAFDFEVLRKCLSVPTPENRKALNAEVNRVVARRGQSHHPALKAYFVDPASRAPYLVADVYTKRMASFAETGKLSVPESYKAIAKKPSARLPRFLEALNQQAGRVVCDHSHIFISEPNTPDLYEAAAILATHTGNTSLFSFAAEVEYHARFLTPLAKIRLPLLGRSAYDSAIRADMTVGDTEFQGPASFYRPGSTIVQRQYRLHKDASSLFLGI